MTRPDGEIRIAYGGIRNTNTHRGGFCPVVWKNGRQSGHTYCSGYDLDDACRRARVDALELKARYAGDWDIRLTDRCARGRGPAAAPRQRKGRR